MTRFHDSDRQFSSDLLSAGTNDRLKHFTGETIGHRRLTDLAAQIVRDASSPGEASIIGLIGPTGVGKSTLRRFIEHEMTRKLQDELSVDRSRLPYLSIEAPSTGDATFSWGAFDKRLLLAAEDPFIDSKVSYRHAIERRADGNSEVRAKIARGDLRLAVEDMLRYRRPPLLMIDEASHMFESVGGRSYMRSLDSLKSMSNVSGTTMVLFGAYDLLTPLGPQLSRRFRVVHFSRYNYEVEADRDAFADTLATMQAHLPVPSAPNLLPHVEDIYVASVGCIGITHTYLRRALAAACDRKMRTVTWELIQEFIDWKKVGEWNAAAASGERDLKPTGSLRDARAAVLGSADSSVAVLATRSVAQNQNDKHRPGHRALHRDTVDQDYVMATSKKGT